MRRGGGHRADLTEFRGDRWGRELDGPTTTSSVFFNRFVVEGLENRGGDETEGLKFLCGLRIQRFEIVLLCQKMDVAGAPLCV